MVGAVVTGVRCALPAAEESEVAQDSVLVLPLRVDANGSGIYPEETMSLVKRLRAAGVSAS